MSNNVQDATKKNKNGAGKKMANKGKELGKKLLKNKRMRSIALKILVSPVGLVLLVIFLSIGALSFFLTMPGMVMDKISEITSSLAKSFLTFTLGNRHQVSTDDVIELGEYLESMGYSLYGYGFGKPTHEKDAEGNDTEEIEKMERSVLAAYLISDFNTYALSNNFLTNLVQTGLRKYSNLLAVVYSNDTLKIEKTHDGMLNFNTSIGIEVEDTKLIKENKKLRISKNHKLSFNILDMLTEDYYEFDIDGWSGRYGKPLELLLTLHLATMAPDLPLMLTVDDAFNTKVNISFDTGEAYSKFSYVIREGVSKDKIINNGIVGLENLLGENGEENILTQEDLKKIDQYYEQPRTYIPNQTFLAEYIATGLKTFPQIPAFEDFPNSPQQERWKEKRDEHLAEAAKVMEIYWKDEPGSFIMGSTEQGEYYISGGKLVRNPDSGNRFGINQFVQFDQWIEDYKYKNKDKESVKENLEKLIGGNQDGGHYKGRAVEYGEKYKKIVEILKKSTVKSYNFTGGADEDRIATLKKEKVITEAEAEALYEFVEFLKTIVREIDNDVFYMTESEAIIYEDKHTIDEFLDEIGISIDGIRNANKKNEEGSGKGLYTEYALPYITSVEKAWFRDIYFEGSFINSKGEWESADGTYSPPTAEETVIPPYEYVPAKGNDGDMQGNEKGYFQVEETRTTNVRNQVAEAKRGAINKRTKELFVGDNDTSKGSLDLPEYYIYDGSETTAAAIEKLEEQEMEIRRKNSGKDEKEIQKLLNTELDDPQNLRRPIAFNKDSLAAFSILEGMKTKDADYILRDLKELLIELEYFTRKELEKPDTLVLDWIIPEYSPEVWPVRKTEKKEYEYGTLIKAEKKKASGESTNTGFEKGIEVITPGKGKITKKGKTAKGKEFIEIEFSSPKLVKGMSMYIEGFNVDNSLKKGDTLKKGAKIGKTTTDNITVILRDKKKSIIENVEDYMRPAPKEEDTGTGTAFIGNLTQEEFEFFAALVEAEAADEKAQRGVAFVIRNRSESQGKTIPEIMSAQGQYEPVWSTDPTRWTTPGGGYKAPPSGARIYKTGAGDFFIANGGVSVREASEQSKRVCEQVLSGQVKDEASAWLGELALFQVTASYYRLKLGDGVVNSRIQQHKLYEDGELFAASWDNLI